MSKTWKEFEDKCYEYLVEKYENGNIKFEQKGKADSTVPDIKLIKNDDYSFYIEVKESNAQSGQFVVLPVFEKDFFVFSSKNKTEENEYTKLIIEYMNNDFDKYSKAGTTGKKLDISQKVFCNWIVKKYKEQNVKYIITEKDDKMILIPIDKFGDYFDISATYRAKRSGSSSVPKSVLPSIASFLKEQDINNSFIDGKLYALNDCLKGKKFLFNENQYFVSTSKNSNGYEIRKLSKTCNLNVIFSILIKKEQDYIDIAKFEKDLI